jgi:prepilin-type N-terminal cleavage/methylation domain-containing protein
MKKRSQSAFTLIEMLVVISIIAVLAAFAVPALTSALTKGQMTGTMNNGRQLYLAGQQMALDGAANSDPNLVWPGDDPTIASLNDYMTRLVTQNYLKAGDVQKLLSGPGASAQVQVATAGTPPVTTVTVTGTSAFKIYPVADADASNVIFATSRNYVYETALLGSNPGPPATPNNPFGDKGFIVQRKGGDAAILRPNNAVAGTGATGIASFEAQVGKKPGEAQGAVTTGDPGVTFHQP